MSLPYPHMLAPLQVGRCLLRNRVVMGSMHTRMEHMDNAPQREKAFYEARASGGAAMLVTGGFAPNESGRLEAGGPLLDTVEMAQSLRPIVDAVHSHGAKFLLQILHAGRYAKHSAVVGPSRQASPINARAPRALSEQEVEGTIDDFVRCAELARQAGFDGVEVMGSEGYLINQFTAPRTNDRSDRWGGSLENRCRLPVELTRRIRSRLGQEFLIMYRISALDLVEGGSTAEETAYLAHAIEAAGADILNTGYGWHEAPVPTIAYQVPRGAWAFAAARLKDAVSIPVMASNRINTPELAEQLIASGAADLVSMARPMLADPDFVNKAMDGRADEINTCIACNQACLDHIFTDRTATCMVNPRACREIDFTAAKAPHSRRIAVVGAGPGGLAAALEAARRGHSVTLFEADADIGGQLNLARRIPGKQEFNEMLRYFRRHLQLLNVKVVCGVRARGDELAAAGFEHVIVATGIVPRRPEFEGIEHPKVLDYLEVLSGRAAVGASVAIIGTGGIGHDVAEFLSDPDVKAAGAQAFFREWGVDPAFGGPGGVTDPQRQRSVREIVMFQRGAGRVGARLGKSTGWIVRNRLRARGVRSVAGVQYLRVDDMGLHILHEGEQQIVSVDHVVLCAGQKSETRLAGELRAAGMSFDLIGGARDAGELDATRAIDEGTRVAQRL